MNRNGVDSDSLYTQGFRQKASLKHPIFESKHISSDNPLQWETRCFGAIMVVSGVVGAGFQVGETITGGTSKKQGIITAVNGTSITYYNYQTDNTFSTGETITGGSSGTTAVIDTFNTGAYHYYDYRSSSVKLQVGLKTGEKVVRRMIMYPPYFSGFEPVVEQTYKLKLKPGVKSTVYVGDELNGTGLVIDGYAVGFFVRSNANDTLTPDTIDLIPQIPTIPGDSSAVQWIDGQGIVFDENAQIQEITYKWLGFGNAELYYMQNGKKILCASVQHAGNAKKKADKVFMRTPSLPASFEIENTTDQTEATELMVVCVNYSSEGGALFPGMEFGWPKITDVREQAIADTDGVVLLGFVALKNNWPAENTALNIPAGLPNRKTWRYLAHGVKSRSKNVFVQLVHIHNLRSITTSVSGLVLYADIPWVSVDGTSAVQYFQGGETAGAAQGIITNWDADHTHYIAKPEHLIAGVGGGGSGQVGTSEFINAHSTISQNYESNRSQLFGLVAKVSEVGTVNLSFGMEGIEVE